jgi:hypothetical protein
MRAVLTMPGSSSAHRRQLGGRFDHGIGRAGHAAAGEMGLFRRAVLGHGHGIARQAPRAACAASAAQGLRRARFQIRW